MSQIRQDAEQPSLTLTKTEQYREGYANSVQVRMSVWDFQLVFGTMHQTAADEVKVENFQGIYLSPQQAKALMNVLGHNLQQYEQTFDRLPSNRKEPRRVGRFTSGVRAGSRLSSISIWIIYPAIFAAVWVSHLTLLRLPYFWDEAGYYIPAAWDLFHTGTLIPQTTTTNAHPPVPSLLLAAWWHLFGFSVVATRTLVCAFAAAGLTAVFRLARGLAGTSSAVATTLLTAIYPIWFAQSTLAHADIFAAAFTLWGLSFYFLREQDPVTGEPLAVAIHDRVAAGALFSLAVLSKETAIVTPSALCLLELWLALRRRGETSREPSARLGSVHRSWALTLAVPVAPLIAWYAYHRWQTGFAFGNPEYLRYNATANLSLLRAALSLWHRTLHLTFHMNLFVATGCALAALLMPPRSGHGRLSRGVMIALGVILAANALEYSILGGALLTRYLLPMYPLVLLLCVMEWRIHLRHWPLLAGLTVIAFLAGIWVNPPYAFAPEDNLAYHDMVVLHQQAVELIARRYPAATVLTAWPATQELGRPELGYTSVPVKTVAVKNFSFEEMQRAGSDPGAYDTAMIFSTKWEPRRGAVNLGRGNEQNDARFFDFHHDLRPDEAARLLHGDVVWQGYRKGEWAAVLRFPRSVNARLTPP